MSDRRRTRVVVIIAIIVIVVIALLLMRCRTERATTPTTARGSDAVLITGGGGSGSDGAQGRSRAGSGSDAAAAATGSGAATSGNATVRLRAGSGGGGEQAGGGGGQGDVVVPPAGGSGSAGDLVLIGETGSGGGKADPDQLGADPAGKGGARTTFLASRLEGVIPASWEDFSRTVKSRVLGDPAHQPPPTSDSCDAQFAKQQADGAWQFIDITIIDMPWRSVTIPASTFEKAKASGGPVEYFRNDAGDFYRASYIGTSPVEENYFAIGRDNKLTFMVADRWQVFVRTRQLPDDVAAKVARQLDLALLAQLAASIPRGTP